MYGDAQNRIKQWRVALEQKNRNDERQQEIARQTAITGQCRDTYRDDSSRWKERTAHLALQNNTGRDVQVTLWHSSAETIQGTWTIPPGFHWVPEAGYIIADPWGIQFDDGCIFYLDEVTEYLMGGGDIPFYQAVWPRN